MNSRKIRLSNGSIPSSLPRSNVATVIVWLSLGLILVATLTPFNFTPAIWPEHGLIRMFFSHPSDIFDIIGNVLMFMPYGLGIAAGVSQHRSGLLLAIVVALVASTTLSLTVETLQLILPSRTSSVIDIFTNSMGGLLGGMVYGGWRVTVSG